MNFPQDSHLTTISLGNNEYLLSFYVVADTIDVTWQPSETLQLINCVNHTFLTAPADNVNLSFRVYPTDIFTFNNYLYEYYNNLGAGQFDQQSHYLNLRNMTFSADSKFGFYCSVNKGNLFQLHFKTLGQQDFNVIKKCDLINWILGRC